MFRNVNGLRASLNEGFIQFFNSVEADIFCIQETKMQQGQVDIGLEGYEEYWNSAVKRVIQGQLSFPGSKQTLYHLIWARKSIVRRDASSPLNIVTSTW